jgi:hypothetical protein
MRRDRRANLLPGPACCCSSAPGASSPVWARDVPGRPSAAARGGPRSLGDAFPVDPEGPRGSPGRRGPRHRVPRCLRHGVRRGQLRPHGWLLRRHGARRQGESSRCAPSVPSSTVSTPCPTAIFRSTRTRTSPTMAVRQSSACCSACCATAISTTGASARSTRNWPCARPTSRCS